MRRFPLMLLMACVTGVSPAIAEDGMQKGQFVKAALIPVRGVVSPRMEAFLNRKLDQANELGCDLVILEIDSPGGYLDSSLNMASRMRTLEWARTVAYVPDEAPSGAAIIALGCDEIFLCCIRQNGRRGTGVSRP